VKQEFLKKYFPVPPGLPDEESGRVFVGDDPLSVSPKQAVVGVVEEAQPNTTTDALVPLLQNINNNYSLFYFLFIIIIMFNIIHIIYHH